MAIQAEYDYEGTILPEAYHRIKKISIAKVDIEEFKEGDDGHMHSSFRTEVEYNAFIFVYPDKVARKNNARVVGTYHLQFEWDGQGDIFECAYQQLKKSDKFPPDILIEDC